MKEWGRKEAKGGPKKRIRIELPWCTWNLLCKKARHEGQICSSVGCPLVYYEAKGKIEKRFDYFQRRIPLLCERYRTKSLAEANRILTDEVAYYNEYHLHDETKETPNKRWARAVQETRTYLRPLTNTGTLDLVFAIHHKRYVDNCGQIQYEGRPYAAPGAVLRRKITVAIRPPMGPRRPHTELYILNDEGREMAH